MNIGLKRFDAETVEIAWLENTKRNIFEKLWQIDIKNVEECQLVANEIIAFQAVDGTFGLVDDPRKIPSDAHWDFIQEPTIICVAILMKIKNPAIEEQAEFHSALKRGLSVLTRSRLEGHGYDALSSQIKAMKYLIEGNLKKYLYDQQSISKQFGKMTSDILKQYRTMLENNETCYGFANYYDDIKEVLDLYDNKEIF